MGTDRTGFENLDREYQRDVAIAEASFEKELQQKLMEAELNAVGNAKMKQRAVEAAKRNFLLENQAKLEDEKRQFDKVHFAELGGREQARKNMEAYEKEQKRVALRKQEKGKFTKEVNQAVQQVSSNGKQPLTIKEKFQNNTISKEQNIISFEEKKLELQRNKLRERFEKSTKSQEKER